MDEVYYENVMVSYKTINIFEAMYNDKKNEIIKDIQKNIKEKYNIDIITNGNESTDTTPDTIRTNPPPDT
jgi:galactose-1-phosphate uridylyltransferase